MTDNTTPGVAILNETTPDNSLENFDFYADDEPNNSAPTISAAEKSDAANPVEAAIKEVESGMEEDISRTAEDRDDEVPMAVPEPESPNSPETYTVKIDGQEVELTIDQLKQQAAMASAANKRFQEAAQLKKKTQEFAQAVKNNPQAFLKQLGVGPDFYESQVAQQIEEKMLTPEQKAQREQQRELQEYRQQAEQHKKQQQQVQVMQQKKQAAKQLEETVLSGFAQAGINVDDDIERSHIMADAMRNLYGWKVRQLRQNAPAEITPEVVRATIRKTADAREQAVKKYLSNLDDAKLVDYLGKDKANSLRKHFVEKVTQGRPKAGTETRGTGKTKTETKSRRKTARNYARDDDFFRGLG